MVSVNAVVVSFTHLQAQKMSEGNENIQLSLQTQSTATIRNNEWIHVRNDNLSPISLTNDASREGRALITVKMLSYHLNCVFCSFFRTIVLLQPLSINEIIPSQNYKRILSHILETMSRQQTRKGFEEQTLPHN